MKIGCVILAGGKSSRMGEDKALLKYQGKSFIGVISEELESFEEKMIARGNNSNIIMNGEWTVIPDEYPDHGPLGGLHATLKKCKSDAMFVVTCDMPLIKKELAQKLCTIFTENSQIDAVISVASNGKIHPLCGVYRKELYVDMEDKLLQDNNRMMAMLKEKNIKYIELNDEESRYLENINTKDDYKLFINT